MKPELIADLQAFTVRLEQFRARWKPTGIDAPYHEREFNTELSYLMARAMDLGSRPAIEALQDLAALAPMPSLMVVSGDKL